MSFFDFLSEPGYEHKYGPQNVARLNARHSMIVEPYRADLEGARVLDLASHDGRWAYALAGAGARQVVGIEARQDLIDMFTDYPAGEVADRVDLRQGDIFEVLPAMIADGERFDVVAVYGFFYHTMEHYRLLKLVKQTGARLVLVDSEFLVRGERLIRIGGEDTSKHLNSIAQEAGQDHVPVGVPSRSALDHMAQSLGYTVEWADWESRRGTFAGDAKMPDYYRTDHWKRRGTAALRLPTTG